MREAREQLRKLQEDAAQEVHLRPLHHVTRLEDLLQDAQVGRAAQRCAAGEGRRGGPRRGRWGWRAATAEGSPGLGIALGVAGLLSGLMLGEGPSGGRGWRLEAPAEVRGGRMGEGSIAGWVWVDESLVAGAWREGRWLLRAGTKS